MPAAFERRLAVRTKGVTSSAIREILKVATRPDVTSFAGGLPAPELFPLDAIRVATDKVLTEHGATALQYGATDGVLALRQLLCESISDREAAAAEAAGLARPERLTPDMVMITTGSQQALDLIAKLGPLPPIADISTREILDAMQHDKKMVAGRLNFVLPTGVGSTTIVDDITEKEMKAALVKVGLKK